MRRLIKVTALCAVGTGVWIAYSSVRNPKIYASTVRDALQQVPGAKLPTQRILHGNVDVCIVGGGLVGLATAREILNRFPHLTVAVLEKESEVAAHQTGHNSGVIHAGLYYKPGSVMARTCVEGAKRMYKYCEQHKLPYERIGKLVCAVNEEEHQKVKLMYDTGVANGVEGLEILDAKQVQELEPNVVVYSALHSPNTGIVDYGAVARHVAKEIVGTGRGAIHLQFEAQSFKNTEGGVEISGKELHQHGPVKVIEAKHVITCAGLHADTVAKKCGGGSKPAILTFRGTYYQMRPEYRNIVKRNIYPVPSGGGIPVGVHFTPTVNERRGQQMIVGPGACLAFHKEGYWFTRLSLSHIWTIVSHLGFWNFARSNFNMAFTEMYRDLNKAAFITEARRLVPSITDDMTEESFCGVMAQVFTEDGKAASDYVFERNVLNGRALNVRSAPSPACTASFAIADDVTTLAAQDFNWKAPEAPKTTAAAAPKSNTVTESKEPKVVLKSNATKASDDPKKPETDAT